MTWLNCHRVANCLNSSQANWDTEPGKVTPKFGYHLSCTGRREFVNLKEVGEVIHCYEIVLVVLSPVKTNNKSRIPITR